MEAAARPAPLPAGRLRFKDNAIRDIRYLDVESGLHSSYILDVEEDNQGYLWFATDNGEFMEGMVAVAVPVYDGNQRLVSTLSVHAPEQRLSMQAALGHVDMLKDSAAQLSRLVSEGLD